MKIPLIRPLIPSALDAAKYLVKARKANQWSNFGPNYNIAVDRLHKLTDRHMIPVTNGTVAIQLALQTVLPVGSRVAIPDFTHIGTYCGVRDAGMQSVLVATEEDTWAISFLDLVLHQKEFDAFIVVAPFGNYVDITQYEQFAKDYDKIIVYDYAGAWGQFPETEFPVCYSLHATKSFSTGEGGLVSFKHDFEAEICRKLTNFGIEPDMTILHDNGANHKMDEIRLAHLNAHLEDYHKILKRAQKRTETKETYFKELGCFESFNDSAPPSLCVLPDMGHIDPSKIENFVCKFYYPLLSRMPHLKDIPRISVSGDYFTKCLALPTDVSPEEQRIIIKELLEYVR